MAYIQVLLLAHVLFLPAQGDLTQTTLSLILGILFGYSMKMSGLWIMNKSPEKKPFNQFTSPRKKGNSIGFISRAPLSLFTTFSNVSHSPLINFAIVVLWLFRSKGG